MSAVKVLGDYLNRITSEHRNQPKFIAYLTALLQPLIDSQGVLRSLLTTFDLDTAIGVQLDATGQWIGRSRFLETPLAGVYFSFDIAGVGFDQGQWLGPFDPIDGLSALDDETYRQLLRAKVLLNNWDGSIPVAAAAIAEVVGNNPATIIMVLDNQDMSMTVGIAGQIPSAVIIALLKGGYVPIQPEGVLVNYEITSVNGTALFGFDVENTSIAGFDVGAWGGQPGGGAGPVSGFAVVSFTATSITLSWLAPGTGTGPYTYQVQMLVNGLHVPAGPPVLTTQATIGGLQQSTSYTFEVFAINPSGPGPASLPVTQVTVSSSIDNASGIARIPPIRISAFAAIVSQFNLVAGSATIGVLSAQGRLSSPLFVLATGVAVIPSLSSVATLGLGTNSIVVSAPVPTPIVPTWNAATAVGAVTVSGQNLTLTGGTGNIRVNMTTPTNSGNWYVEVTTPAVSGFETIGIVMPSWLTNDVGSTPGDLTDGVAILGPGEFGTTTWHNSVASGNNVPLVAGGILGIAYNAALNTVFFNVNGNWNTTSTGANPVSGVGGFLMTGMTPPYTIGFGSYGHPSNLDSAIINAGQTAFSFQPSGYPAPTATPATITANAPFTVSGQLIGWPSIPSLSYIDIQPVSGVTGSYTTTTVTLSWSAGSDSGAVIIPASGVTLTSFTFVHPAVPTGTYTIEVFSGSISGSTTYSVA